MKTKIRKFVKGFIALALSIAMISEAWGGLTFVSEAETKAVPSTAVAFPSSGVATYDFSQANEYVITTKQQWDAFVTATNGTNKITFEGKTIHLGANIDFKDVKIDSVGNSQDNPFKGKFNGQGYTLSNVRFEGGSLFRNISGATVENLVLDKVT